MGLTKNSLDEVSQMPAKDAREDSSLWLGQSNFHRILTGGRSPSEAGRCGADLLFSRHRALSRIVNIVHQLK
jgi:hypothetical protein